MNLTPNPMVAVDFYKACIMEIVNSLAHILRKISKYFFCHGEKKFLGFDDPFTDEIPDLLELESEQYT